MVLLNESSRFQQNISNSIFPNNAYKTPAERYLDSTDTTQNESADAVRLFRHSKISSPMLQDEKLWTLGSSFEAMRVAREPRFDGKDSWTGESVESYVLDPPEPDTKQKLIPRRYVNEQTLRRAPGERVAELPRPDIRLSGRSYEEMTNNDLPSTTRLSNSNPLLPNRTQNKALAPTRLKADDITPSMVLGEEGPSGAYGDRTFRKEYFHGGLHPSTRHKQSVHGVNNLKTNSADYGHINESERHARMLADPAKTPKLRENFNQVDMQNEASVVGDSRMDSFVVQKFKVDRVPVRLREEKTAYEAQPVKSLYEAKKPENFAFKELNPSNLRNESHTIHSEFHAKDRKISNIPLSNQNYTQDTTTKVGEVSKFRNAPEESRERLQANTPINSFKINGSIPTNKERNVKNPAIMYGNVENSNGKIESKVKTSKRDLSYTTPSNPQIPLSNLSSTMIPAKNLPRGRDRSQINSRMGPGHSFQSLSRPSLAAPEKNMSVAPREILNDSIKYTNSTLFHGSSNLKPEIQDVRVPGSRKHERGQNSFIGVPDASVNLTLDSNTRFYDEMQTKVSPGIGRAVNGTQNTSAVSYNVNQPSSVRQSQVPEYSSQKSEVQFTNIPTARLHEAWTPNSMNNVHLKEENYTTPMMQFNTNTGMDFRSTYTYEK